MIPKVLAALCSARHPFVGLVDPAPNIVGEKSCLGNVTKLFFYFTYFLFLKDNSIVAKAL